MKHCVAIVVALMIWGCTQQEESVSPAASVVKEQTQEKISQQEIQSPQQKIVGEEIHYEVDGVPLTGYLAYDATITEPRPAVLVVHEWWGHNEYVRTRAYMLAKMGYTAFALDMYGDGKLAQHPDDAMKFMNEAISQADTARNRFVAALDLLKQQPSVDANHIAAIGYCFGGGVVLNMARMGVDLDGVASFHGSLAPVVAAQPDTVKAKVLVLHGADDSMVTAEQVDAFKKEMEAAGVDYEFISYPGAKHSFTNPGATAVGEKFNMPLAYNKEADEQSWAKLEGFLQQVFTQ